MKLFNRLFKFLFYLLCLPFLYIIIALILSFITVNDKSNHRIDNYKIYISTNGVHLDIIVPIADLDKKVLKDLIKTDEDKYLSFGWGDKNFYINTPTWGDLSFNTAFNALFLNSPTLVHVTQHQHQQSQWVSVYLNRNQLKKLNHFLYKSFKTDRNKNKFLLTGKGYTNSDNFYQANGNYNLFNTCNTWVNSGLKQSGLKACLWTPFDLILINKYK